MPLTNKLRTDILVSKVKKHGAHGSILAVSVLQPTKQGAASLTNAFVAALSSYSQLQFANLEKTQIATQQAYISNLERAIANLPKKPKKVKKPTLPSTTNDDQGRQEGRREKEAEEGREAQSWRH